MHGNRWKPNNRFMIWYALPSHVLKLFEDLRCKSCDEHVHTESQCTIWNLFCSMLQFCYTSDYSECIDFRELDGRETCNAHIMIYLLGKIYGIKDILPHVAQGFQIEVQKMRNEDRSSVLDCVNLIYKLPDLDETDELRMKALDEARFMADTESKPLSQALLQAEMEKHIKSIMPDAGQDLFKTGYKVLDTKKHVFCFRCTHTIDSSGISTPNQRFCNSCMTANYIQSVSGRFPSNSLNGCSITLWQCQSCSIRWTCEGTRTRAEPLVACPFCSVIQHGDRSLRTAKEITWQCSNCDINWYSKLTGAQKHFPLELCICCPQTLE